MPKDGKYRSNDAMCFIRGGSRRQRFAKDQAMNEIRCHPATKKSLQRVYEQHENARWLAENAKYVGCANIPAPDSPDIDPTSLGHQISGGNGPEQISDKRCYDVTNGDHGAG